MRLLLETGPGAPRETHARVLDGALWLDGEPLRPFDRLEGLAVVEALSAEIEALRALGFRLPVARGAVKPWGPQTGLKPHPVVKHRPAGCSAGHRSGCDVPGTADRSSPAG